MARGQFTAIIPTGDTSGLGRRILVSATTNGSAIELHTTDSETFGGSFRFIDYITVEAHNTDSVQQTLYVLWGGTDEPDDLIRVDINPGMPAVLVVDAEILTGGAVLKAYASAADVINVNVRVDRFQQA